MYKFMLASVTLFTVFANAGDTFLECQITAMNQQTMDGSVPKSEYSTIAKDLKDVIKEDQKDGLKPVLKVSAPIRISNEQMVFVNVSLNLSTGQVGAQISNSQRGSPADLMGSRMGAWVKADDSLNMFTLSSPLKGTIAPGFLMDRENTEMTDFNNIEILCRYSIAKSK